MLILATVIRGSTISGIDGRIGAVKDMLFDEQTWLVRYLEVKPGAWLRNRRVLLSPNGVAETDWSHRLLAVSLTRRRVKDSPRVDAELPISRAKEIELGRYYSSDDRGATELEKSCQDQGESRLRSAREVIGYGIEANDGSIGHVGDLIVDDETWEVRYLVTDTEDWLSDKKVLIAPQWADLVNWERRMVALGVKRKTIEDCPAFEPTSPLNRDYEEVLYDYHARPKYWIGSTHGGERVGKNDQERRG